MFGQFPVSLKKYQVPKTCALILLHPLKALSTCAGVMWTGKTRDSETGQSLQERPKDDDFRWYLLAPKQPPGFSTRNYVARVLHSCSGSLSKLFENRNYNVFDGFGLNYTLRRRGTAILIKHLALLVDIALVVERINLYMMHSNCVRLVVVALYKKWEGRWVIMYAKDELWTYKSWVYRRYFIIKVRSHLMVKGGVKVFLNFMWLQNDLTWWENEWNVSWSPFFVSLLINLFHGSLTTLT